MSDYAKILFWRIVGFLFRAAHVFAIPAATIYLFGLYLGYPSAVCILGACAFAFVSFGVEYTQLQMVRLEKQLALLRLHDKMIAKLKDEDGEV